MITLRFDFNRSLIELMDRDVRVFRHLNMTWRGYGEPDLGHFV
jgi:hypothetical protein